MFLHFPYLGSRWICIFVCPYQSESG